MKTFVLNEAIQILERTPLVLNSLLSGLPEGWTNENEGGDGWSPFDILGHLIHGEKTDWMERAQIILKGDPEHTFKPFDRFAQFEASQGKNMEELLREFSNLRKANLAILTGWDIKPEQLEMTAKHPEFGTVSLKQLLATWVAHDLGHLYQISRVLAKNYSEEIGPWIKYLKLFQH